jgi:hypothetical protein
MTPENSYEGMQCLYLSASPDYSKEPVGAFDEIQTIRVMNRYWTEAVNLNIGNSRAFKITQIVVETKSGVLCAYPGVAGQSFRKYKQNRKT